MKNPFRYFKTSPEVIRLAVMMYVRFPLSLRNVEDLLHERGIDVSYETIRFWWNRFGPLFAAEIRKHRYTHPVSYSKWRWHLDEVFVKIVNTRDAVRQGKVRFNTFQLRPRQPEMIAHVISSKTQWKNHRRKR